MSPLVRAIRVVLWLIASGLVATGGMNIGFEFLRQAFKHTEVSVARCVWWSVPVCLGALLALAAPSLARQLAGEDEEEEE